MNKIAEENDMDVTADSAGMFAEVGQGASENAVKAMETMGIDLKGHKTKQLTDEMMESSDLVLTMTEGQKMLLELSGEGKVYTLLEYSGSEGDIPDPFGGDEEEYCETARVIYDALTDVAEKIA